MQVLQINEEEQAIILCYREVCRLGFGRMEAVVVEGTLESLHGTKVYKRKDFWKLRVGEERETETS